MRPIDLLVIGSGPAGQRGAVQAAKLGKRVVLVEKRSQVGGVSVHTGTIPSKTLREAVMYLSGLRQRSFYGRGHRERRALSVEDLTKRLSHTVHSEVDVIRDQLQRNRVEVITGEARFVSSHVVRVIGAETGPIDILAEKILLAPGTEPHRPANIAFDDERVLDSDAVLKMKQLPRSMTVVGSGVIGLEYATIFQSLDVRVSLVDERETLLDFMDREIIDELVHSLRDRNIALRLGERIVGVHRDASDRMVTTLGSGRHLVSDVVLFAAGRIGATAALDLPAAGLSADSRGRIAVDKDLRTSQPHIYAAGDVIGFPSLASTSMEQGRQAVCHAFGETRDKPKELFPFGIYAVPEMSMVGATEDQLKKQGIAYETGVARFRELARGQILGVDTGMLKLIVGLEDHKLLGVHILGEGATELIHVGLMVIGLGGTLEHLVDSVFNYPTLAEAYKVAALDAWNRLPRKAMKPMVEMESGPIPIRAAVK